MTRLDERLNRYRIRKTAEAEMGVIGGNKMLKSTNDIEVKHNDAAYF